MEKQKILEEIAKYAGEINRHRSQQKDKSKVPAHVYRPYPAAAAHSNRQISKNKKFVNPSYSKPSPRPDFPKPFGTSRQSSLLLPPALPNHGSTAQRNKTLDLAKIRSKLAGKLQSERRDCLHYNKTGTCDIHPCSFAHLPEHVTPCQQFLKGRCFKRSAPDTLGFIQPLPAEYCAYSHTLDMWRVPLCLQFLRGECLRPSLFQRDSAHEVYKYNQHQDFCPFIHMKKGETICKTFRKGFYCTTGPFKCEKKHLYACNEAQNCKDGENCPFVHFCSLHAAAAATTGTEKKYWKMGTSKGVNVGKDDGYIALEEVDDDEEEEI